MKKRLSLLIPLLLIAIALISSLLIYVQEVRYATKALEKEAESEMTLHIGQLQNILYNRMTEGNEQEAQLSLSVTAMYPGIQLLLLVDEQDRILLSSRYSLKGEPAPAHSRYLPAESKQSRNSGNNLLHTGVNQPALVQGYFPLVTEYQRGGLGKKLGTLYVEYDYGQKLQETKQEASLQAGMFGAITLASSLLVALILHYLVTKRVQILSLASTRLTNGDYSARAQLEGNDELSQLGESFDRMAQSVRQNILLREQSALQHKRVVETSTDGFWLIAGDGLLLEVNEAYCRMSGYTREELLRMRIPDLEAKESTPEQVRAHMESIFERGWDRFDTVHRRKDGSLIDVEVVTTYWADQQQFFAFIRDISERKMLLDQLRHSREVLQNAQEIGNIGSWELDLTTDKLEWSDEVFRIFERDPYHFPASYEAFLATIHPDDRSAVEQAYTESLHTRQPYRITHRLLFPDGRIKWVEERCATEFSAEGRPLRSIGTVQDITEKEVHNRELRIAAAAFETHEAIMITDAQANIVRVNRAFERITGFSAGEAVGQNPRILRSGRQDDTFYREMWNNLKTHDNWEGEIWDRRKNGEIYPKWLTISTVRNNRREITNYVGIFTDISQRKKAEEEIRQLAFYDPLTQLPNRRLLLERLKMALTASERSKRYGAALFLDLDHFKFLNDTMGHEYGDLLLQAVAERLHACVREVDTVARLGGDEFVILLESLSQDRNEAAYQAELIGEKVRDALDKPYLLKGHSHSSTSSIGIALFFGLEIGQEELFKRADAAMYQAKAAGRNAVRFYDPKLQQIMYERTELADLLKTAIEKQEFELYYQLQVDSDNRPIGAECLIRWIHPERGMIPPDRFIPLAEETKLIQPIGQWVLESACRRLKQWESNPALAALQLAVNVSAVQLHQAGFVDAALATIRQAGIDPRRLKLEITESAVLSDLDNALAKLSLLREQGIQISLDDFGTGYSSLSYLKRLPVDQVKIDRSFVRDLESDPNDAILASAIVSLARNFSLHVIAEGVENEAQYRKLNAFGCQAYQGYLFGKPLPLAQFEAALAGRQSTLPG